MKQWLILIISLLILIFAGVYEINYLENTSKYILSDVRYAKQLVDLKNIEMAKDHFNSLKSTWDNLKQPWGIFIDHEEIGYLDEAITSYKAYLDKNNAADAYVMICEVERLIYHTVGKQEIEIGNIL